MGKRKKASLVEQVQAEAQEAIGQTEDYTEYDLTYTDEGVRALELFPWVKDGDEPNGVLPEIAVHTPWADDIEQAARLWGSFLGEALRRVCGGEWVTHESGTLALQIGKLTLFPHDKVLQRMRELNEAEEGETAEHDVWAYFTTMRDLARP